MDSKKKNLTVCILFGLLLAVAFLACLFLPKEATSDSERRKLAAMPAFTLDTVLSGRFMSGFETYTQDHFPFRDQFRTLKAPVSYTHLFEVQEKGQADRHGEPADQFGPFLAPVPLLQEAEAIAGQDGGQHKKDVFRLAPGIEDQAGQQEHCISEAGRSEKVYGQNQREKVV